MRGNSIIILIVLWCCRMIQVVRALKDAEVCVSITTSQLDLLLTKINVSSAANRSFVAVSSHFDTCYELQAWLILSSIYSLLLIVLDPQPCVAELRISVGSKGDQPRLAQDRFQPECRLQQQQERAEQQQPRRRLFPHLLCPNERIGWHHLLLRYSLFPSLSVLHMSSISQLSSIYSY